VIGTAVAITGCNDLLGPGSAEGHGKDIGSATSSAQIRWTASGDQVTYVSADGRTAFAYHVRSGVTRPLFTVDAGAIDDVQFSADGEDFFTTHRYDPHSGGGIQYDIRRHTAAGEQSVIASGWSLLVARGQPAVAVLSPEGLVFIRRGENPTVYDVTCARIIAFSPDDAHVLCSAGYLAGFVVVRLEDGAIAPLGLPTSVADYAVEFRWDAGGIHVIFGLDSFNGAFFLYDQVTGSSRAILAAAPAPSHEVGPKRLSWSADGTRAAYWRNYCRSENAVSCAEEADYFYVLDLVSGGERRVAVHECPYQGATSPDCNSAQVAISPTGAQIAYAINDRLFLLDVK
jgi:hypothetical protein